MKRLNYNSFLLKSLGLLLTLAVVITSCKKDEEPAPKQTADFATSATTVSEDAGAASTVTINFDKATTSDSELTIDLTNATGVAYTTHYVTNPNGSSGAITLPVASGSNSASFTVTPVDDTEENDARVITMEISAATGSLEVGTATTHTFTITDNDVPATVNFAAATSSVAENAGSAHTIDLTLTSAAVNAGTFDVTIASDNAAYTTDYTTDPDGSTGTFTINVAAGASAASFTVTPVDNTSEEADKVINFTIGNATGGVNLGQSTTHALTITEDDNATLKTIAELRTLYGDGSADVNLTENWMIQGTVVSTNDAVTSRNLFIQDATAGIAIRWDETHTFTQGDNLSVKLQGATLTDFNALVQIGGTMPLTNGTVDSQGNTITPVTVTFAQLNTGDYEGQFVQVENVTFADADGLATVRSNNTGNDGTEDGVVRVESYAPFVDDILPIGTGTIKGIAGTFNTTAQVLPQVASDFFANAPTAEITLSNEEPLDFGSVETGQESSVAKSIRVSGTTLNGDISVTAPDNFTVSLDNNNYSSSVVIAQADAESVDGKLLYVLFAPTSGLNTVHTGDIVLTSDGAVTVLLEVTGQETNAGSGSSRIFSDDFDYGSTAGNLTTITTNWSAHSGTSQVGYVTSSLSMTDYPSSGVGGAATIVGSNSEDINSTFSEQTSGVVYFSALVSISEIGGGNYFFHVKDGATGYRGRIGAKDDGSGGILFGIGASSSTLTYGTTSFALNTTYLIVATYNIDTGESKLFVLDAVTATEPTTPEATNTGSSGTAISSVALRQSSGIPTSTIDGVRVALDWNGIMND